MLSLFDSMFDMSRLTEGQITTNLTAVNLPVLVERLDVQYQPTAAAKGLTLRTRSRVNPPWADFWPDSCRNRH